MLRDSLVIRDTHRKKRGAHKSDHTNAEVRPGAECSKAVSNAAAESKEASTSGQAKPSSNVRVGGRKALTCQLRKAVSGERSTVESSLTVSVKVDSTQAGDSTKDGESDSSLSRRGQRHTRAGKFSHATIRGGGALAIETTNNSRATVAVAWDNASAGHEAGSVESRRFQARG